MIIIPAAVRASWGVRAGPRLPGSLARARFRQMVPDLVLMRIFALPLGDIYSSVEGHVMNIIRCEGKNEGVVV